MLMMIVITDVNEGTYVLNTLVCAMAFKHAFQLTCLTFGA